MFPNKLSLTFLQLFEYDLVNKVKFYSKATNLYCYTIRNVFL